jgi:hypothetical protein
MMMNGLKKQARKNLPVQDNILTLLPKEKYVKPTQYPKKEDE